jgi:hypothetical protein
MFRLAQVLLSVPLLAATAGATPYWISWEGEGATAGLPEQSGWTRNWGNWQGAHQGGASRTLENGILTYDSLYDAGVYDFSKIVRPGQIDPDPGELLVMEWRLKVDAVTGWTYDPEVGLVSDRTAGVAFAFGVNVVSCGLDFDIDIPIAPGVFHSYRVLSWDMTTYRLFIDDQLAYVGPFEPHVSPSYVGWGDSVQGAASLHEWDYFRFGVIPEPGTLVMGAVIACCGRRRRWKIG